MSKCDAMPQTIGVVGVGTMAAAIVRGVCRARLTPGPKFILSPRNSDNSAALAKEFPEYCRVATSNQEVVDGADCIIVAVLPKLADEVLGSLKFRPEQKVISVIGTLQFEQLQKLVAPATDCARVNPLPAVALRRGASIGFPPKPYSEAIFSVTGSFFPVEEEPQFRQMQCMTALMGDFYKRQLTTQQWLVSNGLDAKKAGAWVGAIFETIAADSAVADAHTFEKLVEEQTPGGLNEMLYKDMEKDGAYTALQHSLDSAYHRYVTGKRDPELAPAAKRARIQ